MTEGIWIAMISGVVAIGSGLIGSVAYILKRLSDKESARIDASDKLIDQLQEEVSSQGVRLNDLESRNSKLWWYTRSLVDHIYQGKPPPPPAPPEGLH